MEKCNKPAKILKDYFSDYSCLHYDISIATDKTKDKSIIPQTL